jgi:type III pantothenate kinase
MLFVIDVGNTYIHMGVYHGEKLAAHWDISNARGRTADELGMLLLGLLDREGIESGAIRGVAAACVVPPVCAVIEETFRKYFNLPTLFAGPESEKRLLERFEEPREVGADRIANAVGGFHSYGGPLIVVDFGTATTFDAVDAEGAYLGGAIAPGLAISVDALFDRAARLPRIKLTRPPRAVARDTISSMQAGIIFGYAGLVEMLVRRIRAEIGDNARVVATGGMAELIVRETGVVKTVDQHLTLLGLKLIYDRTIQGGSPAAGEKN